MDPRAELVRRLLEYEQIREIVGRLQGAETERSRRFAKGFVESRPRPSLRSTPLETVWEEVMAAAMTVEIPEPRNHEHRVRVRPVAMSEKVTLILETLTREARVEFSRLLRGVDALEARMHGVMTLLASLELTRRRTVFLRQVNPFSELWIYRRQEEDGGDDGPGGARGGGEGPSPETTDGVEPEGAVAS
jgi:segregation and condensation protein A